MDLVPFQPGAAGNVGDQMHDAPVVELHERPERVAVACHRPLREAVHCPHRGAGQPAYAIQGMNRRLVEEPRQGRLGDPPLPLDLDQVLVELPHHGHQRPAFRDQALGFRDQRVEATIEAHHAARSATLGGDAQGAGLGHAQPRRLLDQRVDPGLQAHHRRGRVQVRRHVDQHRVQRHVPPHLVDPLVPALNTELLRHLPARCCQRVAHRLHPHAGHPVDQARMVVRTRPATDHTHPQFRCHPRSIRHLRHRCGAGMSTLSTLPPRPAVVAYFAIDDATFGLSGLTTTVRVFGTTTRSMSSIGIAPNKA